MSKNDMKDRVCTLSKNDLKDLVKTYRIPLDLHPPFLDPGFTMDRLPDGAICIYSEFLWFFSVRVPFSTFLFSVLKYFKVHISYLVPLGLNKVVSFKVVCRDLNISPIVTLFCVFQCLCKQGDWFSFSKRRNTKDVCMDDGPSSLKKWKDKFFLIDRRGIPEYLTRRHSYSCVSDDLPTDGYDQNDMERLCARLIHLCEMREEMLVRSGLCRRVIISIPCLLFLLVCVDRCFTFYAEMSIYDFMTLPSWSKAKIVKESHHPSLLLLERVPSHTTTQAIEGTIIMLLTLDEITLLYRILTLLKSQRVLLRVVSTPTSRLGKMLGAPPSIAIFSASEPSHVGTLAPTSTSSHSLSLGGVVTRGRIKKFGVVVMRHDDFGTATCGEKIALILFPLAPGPSHMTYLYEGVSSPLYTKEGLLRLEVTYLDDKLERLQGDYDSLGQENRELCSQRDAASKDVKKLQSQLADAKAAFAVLTKELTRIDAKLSKQALTVRDLPNELALEKSKSQGYKDAIDGLREEVNEFVGSGVEGVVQKLLSSDEFHAALARVVSLGADFNKALVNLPTTPFPFLNKIVAASRGMTASVPYVRLNGVSLLLVLGVVLSFHSSIFFRTCTDVETSFIPSPSTQDLNGSLTSWVPLSVIMAAALLGLLCTLHDPMCISFIRYLACCGPMHQSNGP
nr:hypothetical protein [Tanacetum cinerariifolium]